jgi:hypothetical protein
MTRTSKSNASFDLRPVSNDARPVSCNPLARIAHKYANNSARGRRPCRNAVRSCDGFPVAGGKNVPEAVAAVSSGIASLFQQMSADGIARRIAQRSMIVRRLVVSVPLAAMLLALLSASAVAQTTSREPVDFRHATTLAVLGGGAVDTAEAGSVAGGTLAWQMSPKVAVEGVGRWYYRGGDTDAFASALLLQADVFSAGDTRVFLSGGLGLYHASFGPAAQGSMPEFYRRRLEARAGAPVTQASFTDPAVVLGGGLKFALTRHVSLRPSIDATIVPVHSRYHYVTTAAVSVAYRFEHHPVTASWRPK